MLPFSKNNPQCLCTLSELKSKGRCKSVNTRLKCTAVKMQIQTVTQENEAVKMREKFSPAVRTVLPKVQSSSALSSRLCRLFVISGTANIPLKK